MNVTRIMIALAAFGSTARADVWVTAEAPAAIPLSDAQVGIFRPGVMPAFGLYDDRGIVAIGVRARAGVLRNGPAPGMNLSDPGVGGLGSLGLAFRIAGRGPWAEVVVGGGLTGRDLVPVAEAGFGWEFGTGYVDFGPSVRLVHVVGSSAMDRFGNADLVLVGVDARFGKSKPKRAPRITPAMVVVAPVPVVEPPAPGEPDGDAIVDGEPGCADDGEGCTAAVIEVHDDRIVLEERVLFEVARAHVKSRGREMLAELAVVWRAHPEWIRMTIEGHADVRGPDSYNDWLSQLRAERVRDQLVRLGFEVDRIDAIGYGRTRPRDPGTSEEAHQRNRRVEFVIHRRGAP
jgi:outer membrane protein OmpA-like peptidoglycan-associated protein